VVEHYSVVLSGFKRGEEFFRGRMMKQGMKVAQIERVIEAVPCVLKQGLSLDEAKRFEVVFRDAGGIVEVRRDGENHLPPEEDITHDRKSRSSQTRLTPLVQPLPAPPEEPPPAAAGPPLLELESPADSAAAAFAPPGTGAGLDAFAAPPAASEALLDLMDGSPPPAVGDAPAAPHVPTAPPHAPVPVAVMPGTAAPAGVLASTGKPPAVFTQHNPWIFRGIGIGFVVLASIVTVSCVTKYKVGERIHDFSVLVEEDMANDMVGIARTTGGLVGEHDLYKLVDQYARRAHVKVEIRNLQAGYAEIYQGPGGMCSGSLPPNIDHMPADKRMQWMMKVRHCSAPPWIIGFEAKITARVGLSKDTVDVEQWIFAYDWVPSGPG